MRAVVEKVMDIFYGTSNWEDESVLEDLRKLGMDTSGGATAESVWAFAEFKQGELNNSFHREGMSYKLVRRRWDRHCHTDRKLMLLKSEPFTYQDILSLGSEDEVLSDPIYARQLFRYNLMSCGDLQYQIIKIIPLSPKHEAAK